MNMSAHIALNSGRKIALVELRQSRTYYGLLAGRPDKRMNEANIQRAIERAAELAPEGCKPQLIPPSIALRQWTRDDVPMTEERLPEVTCVALFDSGKLARTGSEPYSSALLVWFQDEFGPPIAEAVREQIRELDWETIALDWSW
jgi:hypothetical protein